MTFAKPLYSESGVFLGVAAADINMENVATYVSNYFDTHFGEWFIMDHNHYLVASSTVSATTSNACVVCVVMSSLDDPSLNSLNSTPSLSYACT